MANGLAIVTANYPPEQRGKNIGTLASVSAIGSLAGPSLGGIVIGLRGWRMVFLLNFHIAAIGTVASYFIIPFDRRVDEQREQFDSFGATLIIIAMVSLIYGISNLNDLGWSSARIQVSLILFIVAFIGTWIQERRAKKPILDFKLFLKYGFSGHPS